MKKRNVTKELAITANFMSLVAGGVSMPMVKWNRMEEKYLLEIGVPGVHPKQFSLDVIDNMLMVFQKHRVHSLRIPHLIHKVDIPFDVEVDEIRATYIGDKLSINLPFNALAGGYQRHIDIEPES
jgi:HSP20 family molecular chaperone IbpA